MKRIQIALIVSADKGIRQKFARLFSKIGVSYILESSHTKAILRILEVGIKLGIVDITSDSQENLDFIKVMKWMRPRLSIIAIIDETMMDDHDKVINAGAKYCLVKSGEDIEIKSIIKEILAESISHEV